MKIFWKSDKRKKTILLNYHCTTGSCVQKLNQCYNLYKKVLQILKSKSLYCGFPWRKKPFIIVILFSCCFHSSLWGVKPIKTNHNVWRRCCSVGGRQWIRYVQGRIRRGWRSPCCFPIHRRSPKTSGMMSTAHCKKVQQHKTTLAHEFPGKSQEPFELSIIMIGFLKLSILLWSKYYYSNLTWDIFLDPCKKVKKFGSAIGHHHHFLLISLQLEIHF